MSHSVISASSDQKELIVRQSDRRGAAGRYSVLHVLALDVAFGSRLAKFINEVTGRLVGV